MFYILFFFNIFTSFISHVVRLFEKYHNFVNPLVKNSQREAIQLQVHVKFFFATLPPTRSSDTINEGLVGSTGSDKKQIEYDSALCRRKATVDHRSRAGEYEWPSRTTRHGATLLRRNLQERDESDVAKGPHTTRVFSIRPDSLCSGFEGSQKD